MASSPLPPTTSNGATPSTWSNKSGTERGGWRGNSDSSPALRGINKGRQGGGRGGGRGGRGGRSNNPKGGPAPRNEDSAPKPSTDQPQTQSKPKPPPVNTSGSKLALPPATQPTASPTQSTASTKSSNNKPKPPSRKASEPKGTRGVPNGDAASKPATKPHQPPSASPAPNGRGNPRRKGSQSQHKPPLAPIISVTRAGPPSRKGSVSTEPVQSRPRSLVTAKDVPPHLATPGTPSFDIKHDIDALVERVRAVAMENRPHTPGSHIDWAGDDDDSLPDLDDWGVTSNTNVDPEPGKLTTKSDDPARIISPILENALRPLPTIMDVESIQARITPNGDVKVHGEDKVQEKAASPAIPNGKAETGNGSAVTSPPQDSEPQPENASSSKASLHPSLPPKPASTQDLTSPRPSTSFNAEPMSKEEAPRTGSILGTLADSIHAPSRSAKNPSPEHAQATTSAPSHINTHKVPNVGRGPFQPAHGRSHTVGRPHKQPNTAGSPNFPDHVVDSDRPKRGDVIHHARTHSTPPTGASATRAPHATRPVLTRDAFSSITRSLGGGGGGASSRRENPPVAVTTAPAKD